MSIESVMPSSHLILCRPLHLLPPIPPSVRVFSNESTLRMRWQKYWSFSFSISPSNEHPGLISFRMYSCSILGSIQYLQWQCYKLWPLISPNNYKYVRKKGGGEVCVYEITKSSLVFSANFILKLWMNLYNKHLLWTWIYPYLALLFSQSVMSDSL